MNCPRITSFIVSCVQLLDKAVIDLYKNSHEYFKMLYEYAELVKKNKSRRFIFYKGLIKKNFFRTIIKNKETTQQLISLSLFNKLLCFLLGNPGSSNKSDDTARRWSTLQLREFSIVHELIALIILKCNILSLKTCGKKLFPFIFFFHFMIINVNSYIF